MSLNFDRGTAMELIYCLRKSREGLCQRKKNRISDAIIAAQHFAHEISKAEGGTTRGFSSKKRINAAGARPELVNVISMTAQDWRYLAGEAAYEQEKVFADAVANDAKTVPIIELPFKTRFLQDEVA